jgi:hypothetical protein
MTETKKKTKDAKYWLDEPRNVSLFLKVFFWLCGICLVADLIFFLVSHKHHAFVDDSLAEGMEALPTFYGIYGFLACVALILVSKLMRGINGKKILMREEDYWEK